MCELYRSVDHIKITKKKINLLRKECTQYFDNGGHVVWSRYKNKYVILVANSLKAVFKCPECNIGKLVIIKSHRTMKRFIGCSNYRNGCKASSPLIQKALLRITKNKCEICSWPIYLFRYSRKQKWNEVCTNIRCGGKFS